MSIKRGVILFAGICTAMGLTLSVLGVKAIRFATRKINTATLEARSWRVITETRYSKGQPTL